MTTIHDRMVEALKPKQGEKIRPKEIKRLVLARYPDINPLSVLPGEHVAGEDQGRYCKTCKTHPIFTRVGHGQYCIVELDPQGRAPSQSIHEKLAAALAASQGQLLSTAQIKQIVQGCYPDIHLSSILPADHVDGGPCRDCASQPIFERLGSRGLYRIRASTPPQPAQVPDLPPVSLRPLPSQSLADLFGAYSREELLRSPEALEKQFEKHWGLEYHREIHLLICALKERIPFDLLEFLPLLPRETLFPRLIERLYRNWFIAREFGLWAVESWAAILAQFRYQQAVRAMAPVPVVALPLQDSNALLELWHQGGEEAWKEAMTIYGTLLQDRRFPLEQEMSRLHLRVKRFTDLKQWYPFLTEQLLPWIYSEAARYESQLYLFKKKYAYRQESLGPLLKRLFAYCRQGVRHPREVPQALKMAGQIEGLDVLGASGLLATLFPEVFCSVRPHMCRAYLVVATPDLQQAQGWPATVEEAAAVIRLARDKSAELNERFQTDFWTPRRIENVVFSIAYAGPGSQS